MEYGWWVGYSVHWTRENAWQLIWIRLGPFPPHWGRLNVNGSKLSSFLLFFLFVVTIKRKNYIWGTHTHPLMHVHKHIYRGWGDRLLSKSMAYTGQCPEALICESSWENILFWIISQTFCFSGDYQLFQLILHVRSWSSVCDYRGGNARRNRWTPQNKPSISAQTSFAIKWKEEENTANLLYSIIKIVAK